IPNFVKNLSRSGRELPAMTKLVMSVSAHLVQYWHWYLIALVLLFISARLALKKDRVRYSFDLLKLQLPLFGPLFQKAALARCSRTVATLLQSAVPTLQVFTVAANVVGNEVYARALRGARDSLREGSLISVPLRQEKMFPPLVTQMVAIGEQTGQLDRMFSKIADFYEADVETTVDKLRPMIEPLMILILSVVVGVIITAAIAPIFEMYRSVKN
ncbi:MAG TPA: type II secretion system F family protein, partial [Bacilli bacterium]|nr:type II secretion system F family protein [Bacilli bacterium]